MLLELGGDNQRFLMYLSAAIVLFCLLAGVSARGQADAGQPPALVHCTKVEIETPVRGALASDGGGIYVGTTGGTLTAYDSFDRTIRWRSELGGGSVSGAGRRAATSGIRGCGDAVGCSSVAHRSCNGRKSLS